MANEQKTSTNKLTAQTSENGVSNLRQRTAKLKASKPKYGKVPMNAPDKMQILFTVVNREKTEFYIDLLHNFEINLQMVLNGRGTASTSVRTLLGLTDLEKSVIVSIVRKDRAKDALSALEEKFRTVKNGNGVAYTVPMSSVIGVAIYQFISNKTNGGII